MTEESPRDEARRNFAETAESFDAALVGVLETRSRSWNDISPKVTFGALAAAVGAIGIWGIEAGTGVDIPAAIEGAIVVVLTFAAGYLVPDSR